MPTDSAISDRFLSFIAGFRNVNPEEPVAGDYYDLPDETVYCTATLKLIGGGRIEVNTVASGAPADFEWLHEVTIKDKVEGRFIHLIVRRDHEVVETYGKQVLPVDAARADEILEVLEDLTAS